uniref:Uncharacterized protein n=1 Tax=Strigamia maritima TaxID=126957 RepID=T1IQ36_STRMM
MINDYVTKLIWVLPAIFDSIIVIMYTCEFSCRITVCSFYLLLIVLCIPDANSEYEEIPHTE